MPSGHRAASATPVNNNQQAEIHQCGELRIGEQPLRRPMPPEHHREAGDVQQDYDAS